MELAIVNLSSTPESRRLLASTTVTQLMAKKNQIAQLDDTIVAAIQQAEELESEVCDADTYLTTLEGHIAFLENSSNELISHLRQLHTRLLGNHNHMSLMN